MENQQNKLLASIGGEALAGSGFETEIPITEDEYQIDALVQEQEGDQ